VRARWTPWRGSWSMADPVDGGFDLPATEYPGRFRRAETLGNALSLLAPDARARRPVSITPTKRVRTPSRRWSSTPVRRWRAAVSGSTTSKASTILALGHAGPMCPDGRPVSLTTGLPASPLRSRNAVSAAESQVVPGTPTTFLGRPAGRTTLFVGRGDMATVGGGRVRGDTPGLAILRSPTCRDDTGRERVR